MRIAVFGLWHLGCVYSSCAAAAGHDVVGLDLDEALIDKLNRGEPPLFEPGLEQLIREQVQSGRLRFTTSALDAIERAEVLWVTFDTPVNDHDEADVEFVKARLNAVVDHIRPGTLVMISSQVPVGFTSELERQWQGRGIRFGYSPENLRLGKAIDCFCRPDRVVVGLRGQADRSLAAKLFAPYATQIEWMSVESAEMTKHAINAFLATSLTFINELARECEVVGANAKEVERGLKTDLRIGLKAYLAPGSGFAGGTLARDLRFISKIGQRLGIATPLIDGVLASNALHTDWLKDKLRPLLDEAADLTVCVLGLTYKPNTSTLRRSSAVELCRWLSMQGASVRSCDPAVEELPADLDAMLCHYRTAAEALDGADVAVVATEWPDFKTLGAEDFLRHMRSPRVLDPNWFLASKLAEDQRLSYTATGSAPRGSALGVKGEPACSDAK
jgi:UDPglucose 6-dehydrogenase